MGDVERDQCDHKGYNDENAATHADTPLSASPHPLWLSAFDTPPVNYFLRRDSFRGRANDFVGSRNCARYSVMFMRRPGGQAQFSATLESQQAERNAINELIAWVTDHPARDLSVEAMAERARMSLRSFSRVFRSEVGPPPAAFVEKLRVEAARLRLEETEHAPEAVAESCGFGSSDSMRRSFHQIVKVASNDYHRRFRLH